MRFSSPLPRYSDLRLQNADLRLHKGLLPLLPWFPDPACNLVCCVYWTSLENLRAVPVNSRARDVIYLCLLGRKMTSIYFHRASVLWRVTSRRASGLKQHCAANTRLLRRRFLLSVLQRGPVRCGQTRLGS